MFATHPDRVGESEGDGKRETFRNSDNKHGDADDEVADVVADVLYMPRLLVYHKLGDAVAQDQDHHGHHCDHSTCNDTHR